MRRLAPLVLGVCLVASVCSADIAYTSAERSVAPAATADGGPELVGERARDTSVGWESVVVGEPSDTIVLSFIGAPIGDLDDDPCAGEYEADVIETSDEVRVTIHTLVVVGTEPTECFLLGSGREDHGPAQWPTWRPVHHRRARRNDETGSRSCRWGPDPDADCRCTRSR